MGITLGMAAHLTLHLVGGSRRSLLGHGFWCAIFVLFAQSLHAETDGLAPVPVPLPSTAERPLRWEDWLDPAGAFWAPRRGARTELRAQVGGEGSIFEINELDRIPTVGGTTATIALHHYPVDRLAVTLGLKGYIGLDKPAAGTTASTVFAPFAGLRWDLVRENRFSLLADVQSGPAFFVFADVLEALESTSAVGAEFSVGVPFRYSLGPVTAEIRPNLGGRIGSASKRLRALVEAGPFSGMFAGVNLGFTYTLDADERETRRYAMNARSDPE